MNKTAKIYVAGHNGMVGSALLRKLNKEGFTNLITRSAKELDLRDQYKVLRFLTREEPEYVFLAAAKVGGILSNDTYRASFLYDNLMIQNNVIHAAHLLNVKKLMFFGSTCLYPKFSPQPIKEEYLLTGELEPTNEPYAIAKIAGIKMCDAYRSQYGCNFISVMPTNLYGPNDNYDLSNSHVLPAIFRKVITAHENSEPHIVIWGTGTPRREFLHVDDLADACLFLMNSYNEPGQINIGTGNDISILELTRMVAALVGFKGTITHDLSKPDGTPRKLMDVSKLHALGWKDSISLENGMNQVYQEIKDRFKQKVFS
jgi:GDP-L-fucose synthase